jgi:hypothetical protein
VILQKCAYGFKLKCFSASAGPCCGSKQEQLQGSIRPAHSLLPPSLPPNNLRVTLLCPMQTLNSGKIIMPGSAYK